MELTRRVMTNVAKPEARARRWASSYACARIPTRVQGRHRAQRRHALHLRVARRVEGAVRPQPARHARTATTSCRCSTAGPTCSRRPGKRTTGTGAQTYAITGPGWKGTLPAGVKEYKSPTAMVWILGRIYCTGTPEDYEAVHELQDEVSVVPLSAFGKPYTPPPGKVDPTIDMKTPVRDQVNALDAVAYFALLASLMKTTRRPPPTRRWSRSWRSSASCRARSSTSSTLDAGRREGLEAVPQLGSQDHGVAEGGIGTATARSRTAGCSRRRPACTAPTTCSARWSPRSASAPTGRRTPSIRPPKGRCRRQAVQRRQQVRDALREGPAAAGERVLVADDVRRRRTSSSPIRSIATRSARATS